jgi:primosomal protein N' (replication factor Y) (superfamily II helicase)
LSFYALLLTFLLVEAPMKRVAEIALPIPLAHTFTYAVPEALKADVVPGARCVCPFRAQKLVGVVIRVSELEGELPKGTKSLLRVLGGASLTRDLLEFLQELSRYYLVPIGEVVKLALPPADRDSIEATQELSLFSQKAGISRRMVQWVSAAPAIEHPKLTAKQALVLAQVRALGTTSVARLLETHAGARTVVKQLEKLALVTLEERARPDDPFFREEVLREGPLEATAAQSHAISRLEAALGAGTPATFLLRGVTGSGKTEVYFRAIEKAKAIGKGTLILVPEIALTPQLVERFRARFGDDLAVLHSGLTPKERFGMWEKLHARGVDVAIGARSALFAPIANLGLLIVDEEHDPSFKQEEGVRYHARDMAILRAYRASAVCVLGSATPSLETEHLVRTRKAEALELPSRATKQSMPKVEVIDLRRVGAGPTGDKRISLPLHRALEDTLNKKEQAILFLNRRGFSPSARCEACGVLAECPNCSVALTFHKKRGERLRCHYCEYEVAMLTHCAECQSDKMVLEGIGTEKLEDTLTQAFPSARIARLDRDVASGKDVARVLAKVRAHEVDILVGTQMVTKGHDLPLVTLVGVINADAALSIPDFRAAERAFHLLVQVAGRAGRGDVPGRVLVQTYDPKHIAIVSAMQHDVAGFTEQELVARAELSYPPFTRLVLVRVDGLDEQETAQAAQRLAASARALNLPGLDVLGPAPAPLAKLRNRHRHRLLLRAKDRKVLRICALHLYREISTLPRSLRGVVDIDPIQFL